MSITITKIHLINYKRFCDYIVEPNPNINILAGDNEVGKSSIIEAIDLVASGNVRKVETIGVDKLLNINAVRAFMAGPHTFELLPKLTIELYLDGHGTFGPEMNGKNNTSGLLCDGIRLICQPNQDYYNEIVNSMREQADYFPYDYYSVRFSTFADEGYSSYKKKLRTILIDSGTMNSEYATNDFIKRMYRQCTEDHIEERAVHRSKYRQLKDSFRSDSLNALNHRIPDQKYEFGLKMTATTEFENDLMVFEDDISIDSKGTGRQVFIKTDFALKRAGDNIDVVLLEEPENHLSHTNLRKLIELVATTQRGQLFVTTHNSLISTRLDLQNVLLIGGTTEGHPISLRELQTDTGKFFMKAPVANILEFALSTRAILVEGPSEYMLFERFYKTIVGHRPEEDQVHIIDVHGLSFKRYLEIACLLGNRVAVITDNDHDKQKNCIEKYQEYATVTSIEIFTATENGNYTFEVVLYGSNQQLCDNIFGQNALNYMLGNKTEAAYRLLEQDATIVVPEYIQEAIKWIKE
ncbi:ATP-dependent nuclease [Clostridium phoceensis]|uniref:ATP-dependent nuclease n=1 Tax=Clostridium phoceensis TaxID=1650661 RepID=UPI002E794BD0|nr:TOPRIM nucleotidyl transferase/hydrolase domain-containing protein [Clostridium phoceensis]